MKKSIFLIIVACMGITFACAERPIKTEEAYMKLKWETNFDVAFERAKKEHKFVMVMVEEPTCRWCVKMKKSTLSDPKVGEKLQKYVLLRVKRSDKKSIDRLEGFTSAIPSFHFMTTNKETIETIIGYFESKDFLDYLIEIEKEN